MQIYSSYKITFSRSLTQDELNALCAWNNAYQGSGTFTNASIRVFDEEDTESVGALAKTISDKVYANNESSIYIYDFIAALNDLATVCPSIGFSAWIGTNDYSSGIAQAGTCENANGQFSQTVYNCDPDTYEPLSDEEELYDRVLDSIAEKYYREGYPDEVQCEFDYADGAEERLGIVIHDLCEKCGAPDVETALCSMGFAADAASDFVAKWDNYAPEYAESDDDEDEVPIDRDAMIRGLHEFWNYTLLNYDNEKLKEIASEYEIDVDEINDEEAYTDLDEYDIVNLFIDLICVVKEVSGSDSDDEVAAILRTKTTLTEEQIKLLI